MNKQPRLSAIGKMLKSPLAGELGIIALLGFLSLGYYWRVLFTSDYTLVAGWDTVVQNYAWFQYAARSLTQGVLPLWDPFTYSGHTFIGEGQVGLFYPLNLVLFLLSRSGEVSVKAMEQLVAFHIWLAAIQAYLLARSLGLKRLPSLASSIVFAFGGFIVGRATGQLNIFFAAIWIPAAFWAFRRALLSRSAIFAIVSGMFIGLSVLAGHIQPAFHIALLLAGYAGFFVYDDWKQGKVLSFRPVTLLAVAGAASVLFSAVQLIPEMEYFSLSWRWVGAVEPVLATQKIPYSIAGDLLPFAPQFFAAFILPGLVSTEDATPYVGILPLILVAISALKWRNPLVRFFLAVTIISFLLSMGRYSIVHGWSYAFIPSADKIREAVRNLYLTHFALAVLVGFGLQAVMSPLTRKARKLFSQFAIAVWLGLALFATVAGSLFFWGLVNKRDWAGYWANTTFFLVMVGAGAAVWLTLRQNGLLKPRGLAVFAILLIGFDLFSMGSTQAVPRTPPKGASYSPPHVYYAESEAIAFLRQQEGYFRVDNVANALPSNFGDVFGLYEVMGHSASMLVDFFDFRGKGWLAPSRVHDLLNVRYVVSQKPLENLPLVRDGSLKVYENPTFMPRAWFVSNVKTAPDQATAMKILFDPKFNIREAGVVTTADVRAPALLRLPLFGGLLAALINRASEPAREVANATGAAASSVRIVEMGAKRATLEVDAATEGLLVFSEPYYPGWRARTNGQERQVHKVDYVLRGVYLQPGKQRVEFYYDPLSFKLGLILTLLTLVIAAAAILYRLRFRPSAPLASRRSPAAGNAGRNSVDSSPQPALYSKQH